LAAFALFYMTNIRYLGLKRHDGFTLLELLVVMVIIGMLAGFVAPKFFAQIGKSETKTARAQIDALEKSLDQYRLDVGHYPTTEQGLAALNERPAGESKWAGPYLKKGVPPDPWSHPYNYTFPGEHGEFDLSSYGKDGQAGGTGEAEDIVSW
jgi:general secretion pathway protein G